MLELVPHDRREGLAGFETPAIRILRILIECGMAGLDCYDHASFIVDLPPGEQRDSAEIALDCLGSIYELEGTRFRCELPGFVRAELLMPLASRSVDHCDTGRRMH